MGFLDNLPAGSELKTATRQTREGWEAVAQLIHPTDSPKPVYLGRGATEEEAKRMALSMCDDFWASRYRNKGSNC